jgi:hypothetical protein
MSLINLQCSAGNWRLMSMAWLASDDWLVGWLGAVCTCSVQGSIGHVPKNAPT